MRRSSVRRAVWLLPLSATLALVCALAAFGATTRSSAAPTLVVDNSFTIKTSDPQRAFDPTASIIDRAIYDTLFTYNKGDLTTPIPSRETRPSYSPASRSRRMGSTPS